MSRRDWLELVELLEVAGAWFGGLLVATMATVGAYAWMIGAGR